MKDKITEESELNEHVMSASDSESVCVRFLYIHVVAMHDPINEIYIGIQWLNPNLETLHYIYISYGLILSIKY